jgi:cysteine synthase
LVQSSIRETLDLVVVDRVEQVTNEEFTKIAWRTEREEEVPVGISCGAAAAAAVRIAKKPEIKARLSTRTRAYEGQFRHAACRASQMRCAAVKRQSE